MAVAGHRRFRFRKSRDPLCIGFRESSISNAVFMSRAVRSHLGPGVY